MTTQNTSNLPRIYVACLAAYNSGELHGKWINASQDTDSIFTDIYSMLKSSPEIGAEEWAIHDYEGFGEIKLSEWADIRRVSAIAKLIAEHGDPFCVWYQSQDAHHFESEELEEKFSEQWQGAHDSESAFADNLLEGTGQISELPTWAQNYFDFGSYARDLSLSGDYSFVRHEGQIYVYSNY
jgi:antirestriction protein